MPGILQKFVSRIWSRLFYTKISKYLIGGACILYQMDDDYLAKFKAPNSLSGYQCFQDFFTRTLSHPPKNLNMPVWPCEGFICDSGLVSDMNTSSVKGEKKMFVLSFQPTLKIFLRIHFL
jgi:phosphatidylserine decarboxylase